MPRRSRSSVRRLSAGGAAVVAAAVVIGLLTAPSPSSVAAPEQQAPSVTTTDSGAGARSEASDRAALSQEAREARRDREEPDRRLATAKEAGASGARSKADQAKTDHSEAATALHGHLATEAKRDQRQSLRAVTGDGSISGTITDSITGAPVEGACARIYQLEAATLSACTSASGTYSFTGLDTPATYRVEADDPVAGHQGSLDDQVVALAEGQAATGIDIALQPGGAISGTIRTPSGDPIAGACVSIERTEQPDEVTGSSYGRGCTGADGTYRTTGVQAGDYLVFVAGPRAYTSTYVGGDSSDTATPVAVTVGSTVRDINATLTKGVQISGRVVDPSGAGVGGICLDLQDTDGSYRDFVDCTRADGSYSSRALEAGTYLLRYDGNGTYLPGYYLDAADLSTATPIRVGTADLGLSPISLVRGARIEGTLTEEAGGAPASTCVEAVNNSDASSRTACTDAAGRYSVGPLAAGSYVLSLGDAPYLREYYPNGASYAEGQPVTVTTGEIAAGRDAQLTRGGTISGLITDGSSGQPASACVEAVPRPGSALDDGRYFGTCQDSGDAGYTITGLPTGDWTLRFTGSDDRFITEYWNDKASAQDADYFSVVAPDVVTGKDAALQRRASLSGRVTANGQAPTSYFCVSVFNASGDEADLPVGQTCPENDGSYVLGGLEAGTYVVRFEADDFQTQWATGKASFAAADRIVLAAGEARTGVDADLSQGGRISGTVNGPDGPVGEACVTVYSASDASEAVGQSCAEADGRYQVTGLPAGTYAVEFTAPDYVDQWAYGKASFAEATLIRVGPQGLVTSVDATLARGGSITGTVTDGNGAPVDACVFAYDLAYQRAGLADCTDGRRTSYRLGGLAVGQQYKIFFNWFGNDSRWWSAAADFDSANPVSVPSTEPVTGIDAVFTPPTTPSGARVSGRITDAATGLGLSACIEFSSVEANGYSSVCTSDGSYVSEALPPGTYSYQATSNPGQPYRPSTNPDGTTQTVTVGTTDVAGVDVALQRGAQISGRITDESGAGLRGCVYVFPAGSTAGSGDTACTSNGDYATRGLPDGSYVVQFYAEGYVDEYYDNASTFESARPVTVSLGSDGRVDAALQRAAVVTGTVTDADTGAALANVCSEFTRVGDDFPMDDCFGRGSTNGAGQYVRSLPTGDYTVRFTNPNGRYISRQLTNQDGSVRVLSVTAGTTTSGVDVSLSLGGNIAGRITDTAGAPIEGACAYAFTSGAQSPVGLLGCSNAVGVYTSGGLPAGSYDVQFLDEQGRFDEQWFDGGTRTTATPVSVTVGSTTGNINARLSGSASAPALTGAAAPDTAVFGQPYSFQYTASGRPAPSFSVVEGALPAGLSLSPTGLLSGTPTAASLATFTVAASNASGEARSASTTLQVRYSDVPAGAVFSDDIYWLSNNRLATGFADGSFRPTVAVSRQAFAAYLYRYDHDGVDAGPCPAGGSRFSDVPDSNQFCGAIQWAADQGITGGFADGTFRPTAVVSRQATAAFFYRYNHAGADAGQCAPGTSRFADVPDSSQFCGAISWLATTSPTPITTGFADGTFRPTASVTRQAAAAYFHRYDQDFVGASAP